MSWRSVAVAAALTLTPIVAPSVAQTAPETFRDCPVCPEMAVIPKAGFLMGSPPSEFMRGREEATPHFVLTPEFAIGVAEVTFAEWDACVDAGGCRGFRPSDEGWGRDDMPVINVNRTDALAYVAWLNNQFPGRPYRLPTEAEWERAARAGASTPFWWGATLRFGQANYDAEFAYPGEAKGESLYRPAPARSYEPNPLGLYNVHGNLWEWVGGCWVERAPDQGYGARKDGCRYGVLRGGSWFNSPWGLRAANRFKLAAEKRYAIAGFRVARDWP